MQFSSNTHLTWYSTSWLISNLLWWLNYGLATLLAGPWRTQYDQYHWIDSMPQSNVWFGSKVPYAECQCEVSISIMILCKYKRADSTNLYLIEQDKYIRVKVGQDIFMMGWASIYESSEFTKRLIYYPGSRWFFQCSNAELSLSPTKIDGFPHSGNFVVFVQSL